MIIKFQIYSILHPIPSKGILESHTNVLLNRKRIFKFLFYNFFSGTGEREVPSTYLRNASVYPCPPTHGTRFAAKVLSVPMEGRNPYLLACSSLPGSSVPTSSNVNFRAFPRLVSGREAEVPEKWPLVLTQPLTLLGTRQRVHVLTSLASVSPSVTRGGGSRF